MVIVQDCLIPLKIILFYLSILNIDLFFGNLSTSYFYIKLHITKTTIIISECLKKKILTRMFTSNVNCCRS